MSADNDALARAWDAGFDAAATRAQLALLMSHTVGVAAAVQHFKADAPAVNPYRVTGHEATP